ncbi:MAG: LysM peptidoglycan-binding domain-containing protein [Lachnospiraceae bacterium]
MADINTVSTAYIPVSREYRTHTSSGRRAGTSLKSTGSRQPVSAAGRAVLRNRRIRRARMKRRILFVMILLALAAMFIFGRASVHAINTADENRLSNITYQMITVEDGDTLWDIASEWSGHTDDDVRTYLDKIREMNGIKGDLIRDGQQLLIYYDN